MFKCENTKDYCGLSFRRLSNSPTPVKRKKDMKEEKHSDKSAFVFAYSACAFSGFLVGVCVGLMF